MTWQNAQELRRRLMPLAEAGSGPVVLDVAGVPYVDPSGLAVLLACDRRLKARGRRLVLFNANDAVLRAMRQTRLCDRIVVVSGVAQHCGLLSDGAISMPTKVIQLSVPKDPALLSETRAKVATLLAEANLSQPVVFDLVMALGEALSNAFDHGGGALGDGLVVVGVELYDDRVVMTVSDCGDGFAYEEGDELPETTEERGRGIRLMLMLTDAMDIRAHGGGHGTSVRLIKAIVPGVDTVEVVDTDERDFLDEVAE